MNGGAQVPERYLLPEAVGAIMPGRVASLLHKRLDLSRLRTEVRGIDPEVDAVLMALHIAALKWRTSAGVSEPRKPTEVATESEWMSTQEVADRLGVSTSRVRQECRDGRLEATNRGRPLGWQIHREDFEHYRAARAA